MNNVKILVVCGPTAIGKTTLAARIAKKFDGELISADSRQVYREMLLTVGKELPEGVKIWGYDLVDPNEEFSVNHWVLFANTTITDIVSRGKMPIVVGGTGLYIRALLKPLETIHIPPDLLLRKKLNELSIGQLQALVTRDSMNDSDWNNPRRLIRKIEIQTFKKKTGKTASTIKHRLNALMIGLTAPLAIIDTRIQERLKERLRLGLESEINALHAMYDPNLPAMSAIGLNEQAYARRQLTWFRKEPSIQWFDITDNAMSYKVEKLVEEWYTDK
jgi:tRNA dimethylallyltransferase